ncbi:hypothetical protein [Thiobacter aerophilum]|uniref:AAA+ ATPase domain-containing protein n=1 Tax=Thiobacter aerophilum TaxID=3121275 RepID=A0ABV0EEP3_9BURK
MSATTVDPAQPLSTHAYQRDIPPSVADGVVALLGEGRQIIVVTGKTDGRMSGFLADLCHGISRRGTLLRIKAPLPPEAFHAALAAQLKLPASAVRLPLPARVGRRLSEPAPRGRFVLLCEGADRYEDATLEAIRQLSNYPLSIVLTGSHRLLRRLADRRLAPLRQRITHRLALNRSGPRVNPFWLTLLMLLGGGGALIYSLWTPPPTGDAPVHPISAPQVSKPARTPQSDIEHGHGLKLRLERELSTGT